MVTTRCFIASVIVLIICRCVNETDDTESFIAEDVTEFNHKISAATMLGEQLTTDPVWIVRELFRSEDFERHLTIEVEAKSHTEVTIIFTREGLEDDSLAGEKRILELARINNTWTITHSRIGFKCWESRGHTNYSGEFCS
jgi:hypothetical protein